MGRYSYEELHRAVAEDPTHENRMALGEWFQEYGMEYWNGEFFDADDFRLVPIYDWDEETAQGNIIDYELR